jgi:hypothetical protein
MNRNHNKTTQTATSPENELLNVVVGRWHTTGEVVAAKPALKIDSIDTYEWLPGGYSLIHYADSNIGDDKIHSIEIIGYDASRKMYFAPFFDDQGGAGWEEIRVKDNTWTWHGKDVMGAKYHRCRAVFSEDGNTIEARHERSEDDKNWEVWMDIVLTKIL